MSSGDFQEILKTFIDNIFQVKKDYTKKINVIFSDTVASAKAFLKLTKYLRNLKTFIDNNFWIKKDYSKNLNVIHSGTVPPSSLYALSP